MLSILTYIKVSHLHSCLRKSKTGGRNNQGRITTRHIGGGHKQHYRIIDFKRTKTDIPAIVERIEYDPNRTANIALLLFKDGERKYIIAPTGIEVGQDIISSETTPIKPGIVCLCATFHWVQRYTVLK